MNEQGSDGWMKDRCGSVTGSRITDVLAKPLRGAKEATTRRNYKAELVCERLTGRTQEGFVSYDMKRGTELEPFARADYEVERGVTITNVGFVPHPTIKMAGVSPDGLIDKDGLVEFKAPKTANHLEYLTAGIVPTEYRPQMLWEMACTGRKYCDFVSYDPHMPEHLQLFIVRFDRDDVTIAAIEAEVIKFNAEIDEIIHSLPSGQPPPPPLRESVKETIRKARNPESELEISNADFPK